MREIRNLAPLHLTRCFGEAPFPINLLLADFTNTETVRRSLQARKMKGGRKACL